MITRMRIGKTEIKLGGVMSGEHLVRSLVKAEGRRVDYVRDGNSNDVYSDKNIKLAGICLALGKYKDAYKFYLASKLVYKIPPELKDYVASREKIFLFKSKKMREQTVSEGVLDKRFNRRDVLKKKREERLANPSENFPSKLDKLAILPLMYNATLDESSVFSEDEIMNYFGLTHFELRYHLAKSEIKAKRKISKSPGIDGELKEYFEKKRENRVKKALDLKPIDINRKVIDRKSLFSPLNPDELQFMYTARIAGDYVFSEDEICGFFGASGLEARLWLDTGIEPERTMELSKEEEEAILDLAGSGFDVQSIELIVQANKEEIINVLNKNKIQLTMGERISRERAKVINEVNKGKLCLLKIQNTSEFTKAGKAKEESCLQGT